MATIFGVQINKEVIPLAHRFGIPNGKVGITWLSEFALLLPATTPVIAMDNSAQGVDTIGDLRMLDVKEHNVSDVVDFIPNLEVGVLKAIIICKQSNKVVLLCQDRIIVAVLDGYVYRPYPESQPLDLYEFINKN
jgi:hypothetical protein